MPEGQIIYIDDYTDPSPLSLLERQVDCLLMPPPTDTTPIVQRAPMTPRRDQQPPKVLERRRHPPGTAGKKTFQERREGKPLKLNIHTVAKMCTGPAEAHRAQDWPGWPVPWFPSKGLTYKKTPMLRSQKLHRSVKHPPLP